MFRSIPCSIITLVVKDLKPEATRFLVPGVRLFPLSSHAQGITGMTGRCPAIDGLQESRLQDLLVSQCLQVTSDLPKPTNVNRFPFFSPFPIYYSFSESWWGEIFSSRGNNIKLKSCVWWNGEIIPLLSFEQKKKRNNKATGGSP